MSFIISIPEQILPKAAKFKENEIVDWSKKNLSEQSEAEVVLNLVQELEIDPKAIFKHLKVNLGEQVKQGQLLAQKKAFLTGKNVFAPSDAEVRKINHEDGTLTLVTNRIVEVPFGLRAKFLKKDKDNFLFKVAQGVEVALQQSSETCFGGECSYIQTPEQISLEAVERKVVISRDLDLMEQAKLTALGPLAMVSYEASYRDLSIPLLLLANKTDWKDLFAKKYELCLYLMSYKTIYFYNS